MVNKIIVWSFVFCIFLYNSCAPDGDRSSAPILVLATSANFGTYTGEILKAEGFNEFIIDSLTDNKITPAYLTRFDIVILKRNDSYKRAKCCAVGLCKEWWKSDCFQAR